MSVATRAIGPTELNADHIARWEALEARALEPNAFLSPHFVLPAVRLREAEPLLLLTERDGDLLGVAAFEPATPSLRIPLPHLRAFGSEHSYLAGALVDRDHATEVLQSIAAWARDNRRRYHGIELSRRSAGTRFSDLLDAAARDEGLRWNGYSSWERAAIRPSALDPDPFAHWSKSARKQYRRKRRALESRGRVTFEALRPADARDEASERFLALEHLGWKGEGGTSLASDGAREAFYRAVVDGFAKSRRAVFTQLRLDDAVIASSCNLISGNAAFAFKIGWDPEFAELSPGVVHEHEFVIASPQTFPGIELIDGVADEGSFIERIWPHRFAVRSGWFASTGVARAAGLATGTLKKGVKGALDRIRDPGSKRN